MDRARLYESERSLRAEAQVSADLLLRASSAYRRRPGPPDLRELTPARGDSRGHRVRHHPITLVDETGEFLQPVASWDWKRRSARRQVRIGDGFTPDRRQPEASDCGRSDTFRFVNPIFAQKGFPLGRRDSLVVGGHVTGVLYAGLYHRPV
jgi:hypothetical protein